MAPPWPPRLTAGAAATRVQEEVIPSKNFYYQSVIPALHNDGDIPVALDVLARHVGILGIFSDWSATVTYYANCMGL